jgi:hypothetical protein
MNPAIERIRHAITRGEYPQASELWNHFASELQDRIRAGRLPASEWTDVAELFTWSRNVLLCARAQALDLLNTNHVASTYGHAPQSRTPHIRASL